MTYDERRKCEMLDRVQDFGVAHRQLFPETTSAAEAFAAIEKELPQLEELDIAERVARHSARATRKAEARKPLLEWLTRAKNNARALSKTIPDLAAHVDLPASLDDRLLLTVARQFEAAIAPHAEPFAANGIAIAALGGLIQPFEPALRERGLRKGEKAEARARIIPAMARAYEALATLDLTVPNHLAGDAVTLAAWKRSRQIIRPRSKKAAVADKAASASPAQPEAASTETPEAA